MPMCRNILDCVWFLETIRRMKENREKKPRYKSNYICSSNLKIYKFLVNFNYIKPLTDSINSRTNWKT